MARQQLKEKTDVNGGNGGNGQQSGDAGDTVLVNPVLLNPRIVNPTDSVDDVDGAPELSAKAQQQLKDAWLAGKISDKVMDELDPDGLIDDSDNDDDDD